MRLTSLLYVGPLTAGWGFGCATMRCRAAKSTRGAAVSSKKRDSRRDMIGDDTPDRDAHSAFIALTTSMRFVRRAGTRPAKTEETNVTASERAMRRAGVWNSIVQPNDGL